MAANSSSSSSASFNLDSILDTYRATQGGYDINSRAGYSFDDAADNFEAQLVRNTRAGARELRRLPSDRTRGALARERAAARQEARAAARSLRQGS